MPLMSNKVYQGQSFLDKAIECTGSVESVFEMALLNSIAITDDIAIGSKLQTSAITYENIVAMFGEFNKPATMLTLEQINAEIENSGIGYMIISNNFIVT
jgi:hypothetical protein